MAVEHSVQVAHTGRHFGAALQPVLLTRNRLSGQCRNFFLGERLVFWRQSTVAVVVASVVAYQVSGAETGRCDRL